LKGEAKITKKIAQKAAATVPAGKTKIIDDIEKYNLQSTKGGFKGIAENAQEAIDSRMEIGKEALQKAAADNPDKTINLDGITAKYRDDLAAGNVKDVPFDQVDKAEEIRTELVDKLKKQLGFDINNPAELSLEQANRARQLLSQGAFKKGAYFANDPIRDQVKQDLALHLRDAMADYVPELTQANKEIRDLINIKKATEAADARIAGHNQVLGMGNAIAGGLGGLAGHGPWGAGLGILGKKALESGRGASGLMSIGGKMSNASDALRINPALATLDLYNQGR
jgi:hypothetical protein